jgi:hypothetical protein
MTHHDNDRRNFDEAPVRRPVEEDESPGWGLPIGIAAVALVAGILIFSTAGPDRTKTAQVDPSAKSAPAEQAPPPAAPAPAQKSNPAGTQ